MAPSTKAEPFSLQLISRADAKAQGLKRYFTDKPCKHGHVAERFVSTRMCAVCAKSGYSNWYNKNKPVVDARLEALSRTRSWQVRSNARRRSAKRYATCKRYFIAKDATRRARKLQATPPWVDQLALRRIYRDCPEGHHVDHIVPLKHPLVCGLHVPWNLQYLPARENLSKGNRLAA